MGNAKNDQPPPYSENERPHNERKFIGGSRSKRQNTIQEIADNSVRYEREQRYRSYSDRDPSPKRIPARDAKAVPERIGEIEKLQIVRIEVIMVGIR